MNPLIHYLRHGKKEGRVAEVPNQPGRKKIGIVLVSHNASLAVRTTLASLRRAKNITPHALVLVDNASLEAERNAIRHALDRHVREADLPWQYIQLNENLGFSGGNNAGIKALLNDETISHICLLNSDVIVSDYWLDRLVQNDYDMVSPVTNKAASIQSVPINYDLDLPECLNTDKEALRPTVFEKINKFSNDWFKAWQGNAFITDQELTFFCVVISRTTIQKVGLLDTTFFPGGFEDYDYCLRVRSSGGTIGIARDVFIHHWGSASFSQLSREFFNENAFRNRHHLEQKYGIVWTDSPQAPFISYGQDVLYALKGKGGRPQQRRFLSLYANSLTDSLIHYTKEFVALQNHLRYCGRDIPAQIKADIAAAPDQNSLVLEWNDLIREVSETVDGEYSEQAVSSISAKLAAIARDVYKIATCNIGMANFLFDLAHPYQAISSPSTAPKWIRVLKRVRRGISFIWHLNGIVFFGGYPYPERENDGYFQRIRSIDSLFPDKWRVYIDQVDLPNREGWYDWPAPRVLVLRVASTQKHSRLARLCMALCIMRIRIMYFHSILPLHGVEFLMKLPGVKKILDIHGSVPEEFYYYNDIANSQIYGDLEKFAVKRAKYIITVSETMRRHLEEKYRSAIRGKFILLPIFQKCSEKDPDQTYHSHKPVIVYAGGLQKWQQVPKMVDVIRKTADTYQYKFYCPRPEEFLAMLPEEFVRSSGIVVESKTTSELYEIYSTCDYGLILREENILNRVASPTKLIEYISMGIVPIVDYEDIGDFKSLGMQFVRLNDLLEKHLPDEKTRQQMANENYHVFAEMKEINLTGSVTLQRAVEFEISPLRFYLRRSQARIYIWANRTFPANSIIRRIARQVFRGRKVEKDRAFRSGNIQLTPTHVDADTAGSGLPPSDILVQVDNMLAGGLENAVLDIIEALRQTGYRVGLLVLGEAGLAVERAKKAGIPVLVTQFEPTAYENILNTVSPKLVLSHYSIHGAAICEQLNIPLVQMIHNLYMWFSDEQLIEFQKAEKHTKAFIIPSESTKTYSKKRLGVPEEKCCMIPYGIDYQSIKGIDFTSTRSRLRMKYRFTSDDFVFLSVAAINHQKNIIGLVKAFHLMLADCPNAKLVLLGPLYEVELFETVEKYIIQHDLQKQIIYAGQSKEASSYYAMADAFVCTSFFEAGPQALLEALASNLPAVTARVGYASQFENHAGVGIVPPPIDILKYHGPIWKLHSTKKFEQNFAAQMVKTYHERTRPNLPPDLVEAMDKKVVYTLHNKYLTQVLQTGKATSEIESQSWLGKLHES
ncbi:MAG TPA: glycosyltransferase [Anaerolineales bacterium]|nr:glycosyltransferase [Anaerolineales bacterium]